MNKNQTRNDFRHLTDRAPAAFDKPVASAKLPVHSIGRKAEEGAQQHPGDEPWSRKFDQLVRWELWV